MVLQRLGMREPKGYPWGKETLWTCNVSSADLVGSFPTIEGIEGLPDTILRVLLMKPPAGEI